MYVSSSGTRELRKREGKSHFARFIKNLKNPPPSSPFSPFSASLSPKFHIEINYGPVVKSMHKK